MKFFNKIASLFLILGAFNTYAKDLGILGETYVIAEKDFMEYLKERVEIMTENGAWDEVKQKLVMDAQKLRDRPRPVENISKTLSPKSWFFDPSIVLENDIKNEKGEIIALQGKRINPLEYTSLTKAILFIDSDDKEQLAWASKQNKMLLNKTKIILVHGSLLETEKELKSVIYFDQEGRLVKRFGIRYVPAVIVQEERGLRISEVTP